MSELVFKGIDGANPLGFLAAVGTLVTVNRFCPNSTMAWRRESGSWRPVLFGCEHDEADFCETLAKELAGTSSEPFEFESRLPFSAEKFSEILGATQSNLSFNDRRCADLLGAFGSEICREKENFQDTFLRMVRSGDSKGQGLPAYAIAIKKMCGVSELKRTLFEIWDYADDCFRLR